MPWRAQRLERLPPYLFVEIARRKRKALAEGRTLIDFGVGDPDHPTPTFIIDKLCDAARDPANHRYPADTGLPELRQAAAEFCRKRFDVRLDPDDEVLVLIGTKEGLGHLPLSIVNPGDVVLVPDPAYPVYESGSIFAGATVHRMPLAEDDAWLPRLDDVPPDVAARARLMFLNYPNNPTAAAAPLSFFERAVDFARRHDLLIVQDAAYSELFFDAAPPSILQVPGAIDRAVELHSLSKTFNMTGWRVGFAVGNRDALASLALLKSNVDSSAFNAIQWAACAALANIDHIERRAMIDTYRARRDALVDGLTALGYSVARPAATFYVWARCPDGYSSMDFAAKLLADADVVVVPGVGFGQGGEGYFRMALTVQVDAINHALARLAKVSL